MFKLTEAAVCEAAPPGDAPCTSCGQCLQRSQGVGHPWGMPSDTHTFSSDWWTCEEASCRSKWCSEGCNCISFSPYYLHPETEVPTHHSPWEQTPNTTQAGRQLTAQGLQLLVLFLKKDKYFISTWKLVLLTRSRFTATRMLRQDPCRSERHLSYNQTLAKLLEWHLHFLTGISV